MSNGDDLRALVQRLLPEDPLEEYAAVAAMTPEATGGDESIRVGGIGSESLDPQVASALSKVRDGQGFLPEEEYALEAIVLPEIRPVIDIVNGDFIGEVPFFPTFTDPSVRARLTRAIPSIGRIGVPDLPQYPYAGTGFVVGHNLLMTNRHVAALFADGLGRKQLSFRSGQSSEIDFKCEGGSTEQELFGITRIIAVHPYWDMAILETRGLDMVAHPPLSLASAEVEESVGRDIAVIGYPAPDPRNDPSVQQQVFGGRYYAKRLQPGVLRDIATTESFKHSVDAVTHDASTLGGNSGSAVLDTETGKVVGLHFGGRYLKTNYAVPMAALATDSMLRDLGLTFDDGGAAATGSPWKEWWAEADREVGAEAAPTPTGALPVLPGPDGTGPGIATASYLDGTATVVLPLEITVRIGDPMRSQSGGAGTTEAAVEPYHEDELGDRTGYDDRFLGPVVPLPTVSDASLVSWPAPTDPVLRYEHFSIVMNAPRRIAFFTASNVDASANAKKPEPGYDYGRKALGGLGKNDMEKWFNDPRIPAIHQLPNRFFDRDRKAFDKGHLVRRDDVAWGTTHAEVRRANGDTFHVTNCSPQVAGYNRSNLQGRWGQLENKVLTQAAAERLTVFSGPVFDRNDRWFAGVDDVSSIRVKIPRRYWKVVIAAVDDEVQSFAFLLTQDLDGVNFGQPDGGEEFAVGSEWTEFLIPMTDLADLIDPVVLPQVVIDADQSSNV